MVFGKKENMILMAMKFIMKILIIFGVKVNLIPMAMKFIMRILVVTLMTTGQNHVKAKQLRSMALNIS